MSMIGIIQTNAKQNLQENLNEITHYVEKAVAAGAQLIVLPEMFPLMSRDKIIFEHSCENYGEGHIQSFIATIAAKHKVWIIAGTMPIRCHKNEKPFARTLVFDDTGKEIIYYDKIHLFDATVTPGLEVYQESDKFQPGHSPVIFDSPFGRIGLAVCYDLRFPELFRYLFNKGAEIFVIPAAFIKKTGLAHFETLLRARAIENFSYVISANQCGQHEPTWETYGHSKMIDPWGKILHKLGEAPGFFVEKIDLHYLHEIRKYFPVDKHQRLGSVEISTMSAINRSQ